MSHLSDVGFISHLCNIKSLPNINYYRLKLWNYKKTDKKIEIIIAFTYFYKLFIKP